jgi:hypothetical protein
MTNHFDLLLDKLDRFIRRYYLNQLLKGSLLFGAGFLILFLVFVLLEYIGYFNQSVRFVLFYGFLLFNGFVLIRYVVRPLLGLIRIGKRIGPEEAGRILGIFFKEEIRDKITNTLQLKQYLDKNQENAELVMAGIDQKAAGVSVVPFQKAIDLRGNLRFLPFFLVPLFFTLLFFVIQPALLLEPVQRIVRYDTHFERPAPFYFEMESPAQGFRNENLTVVMRSRGNAVPADARLIYQGGRFNMEALGGGKFRHNIRNIQESFELTVESGGFRFGPFPVEVVQKPVVHHFSVKVDPPAYTGLQTEQHNNVGDLIVPEGSRLSWEFNTRGTGAVSFFREGERLDVENIRDGVYQVSFPVRENFEYKVFAASDDVGKGDSLEFFLQVRPDAYPQIQVEEHRDSVLLAHSFHRGMIQDDYGFTRLEMHYRVLSDRDRRLETDVPFMTENIDIDLSLNQQVFYHHLDMNTLYVQPGESVEYFFQVYDNDGIRGPKASRSQMFSFYVPTREELLAQRRESDEQIKSEISDGIGEIRQARDEIDELRRQLLESERMSWEQREAVKNLLEKQERVQENFERLSDQKKQSEVRDEQFQDVNERLKQKQEELQRLFDEVLSDELKELFDKIREELEQLNRDQVYEMLDQMEFEFRDLEMQMDRALELFRQLEMERLLQQSLDLLDQARQEQAALSEETETGGDSQELAEKQEAVKDQFEQVKEMLEEFREKNQELNRPHRIDDTSAEEESIMNQLQQALEQLQQNQQQQSQQHQQQGQQQMDQLSMRLQDMQQQMFEEQLAEDARALRQILENLLKSSFAQEDLMLEIRSINVNDPRYVELVQEQRKIQDDLRMVEDSLIALSKRQIQIQSYVNREIAEVNMNLRRALDDLVNRRRFQGASRQQFVMTHINNLALLLNESLQNMQAQMAAAQGMGDPNQQGGGEPSFQNLRNMQQGLNEMLQQIQDGHQPMPGETGETMSMSEQLARMAAEQEAIRNQLQKLANEIMSEGGDLSRELDQLQRDMERTELDIVSQRITRQTMLRQERILTRLLEHERAELQREMEERREGTTAENYDLSNPAGFFEYNRIRNRELEMLRRVPAGLKPYYRSLVETYFLNVE